MPLGFRTPEQAQVELREVGAWDGARVPFATEPATEPATAGDAAPDGLRLATWKPMIGDGRMLDGADDLRATARSPVALVSAETLARIGGAAGAHVTLTGPHGSSTFPVGVADLPDAVVWTPTAAAWAAAPGSVVRLALTDGARA